MKRLLIEKIARIIPVKNKLEQELEVTITNRGKEIIIEGNPEKEHIAEKIIDAIDFGFPINEALLLKNEEFMLIIINLKEHTKKTDLKTVRGRIIGVKGKTLRALTELTGCFFEIKNNQVAIIGESDRIKAAERGIISIAQGSEHGNVYAYLEKHRPVHILDLGIKDSFKKKLKKGIIEDSQEKNNNYLEKDEEE